MMRQLGLLLAGSFLVWLSLATPAWFLAGDSALVDTLVAYALCLLPMAATLLWSHLAFKGSPEQQLAAVMGGTGLRLVLVIGGSIGLFLTVDALSRPAFLIWVVVFYLATLALEVVLLVSRQNTISVTPRARPERSQS